MSGFEYQHKKKFSETEYVELERLEINWTLKSIIKKIILIAIGVILLFFKYTIGIGVLVLFLFLFLAFMPLYSKSNMRKQFRETPYWHEELTFGVDQDQFWVTGKSIGAKCKWKNLKVWQIKNNWLTLSVAGIPKLYFPIVDLKENNVYEELLALCHKYGVEFDNPKAKATS